MEWLGVGITILGTAGSVGGIVLYVFNGTKKLIKEIHATTIQTNKMIYKMNETMKQNHRDSLRLLNKIVDLIDSRLPAEKRAGKIKRKSLKH